MFKDSPVVYNQDENIRELIIDYLRDRKKIEPKDVLKKNWTLIPTAAIEHKTLRYAAPL
jgi:hypothetical protein